MQQILLNQHQLLQQFPLVPLVIHKDSPTKTKPVLTAIPEIAELTKEKTIFKVIP